MQAGTVFLASVIGLGSGFTALVMGMSAWLALLIYSTAGILTIAAILSIGAISCWATRMARPLQHREPEMREQAETP